MYGMAQSIPDRSLVSEIASVFFDAYYDTEGGSQKNLANGEHHWDGVTSQSSNYDVTSRKETNNRQKSKSWTDNNNIFTSANFEDRHFVAKSDVTGICWGLIL